MDGPPDPLGVSLKAPPDNGGISGNKQEEAGIDRDPMTIGLDLPPLKAREQDPGQKGKVHEIKSIGEFRHGSRDSMEPAMIRDAQGESGRERKKGTPENQVSPSLTRTHSAPEKNGTRQNKGRRKKPGKRQPPSP